MKYYLLLFTFSVVLLGCKKEYSDEDGAQSALKCVNCSYLPLCDSSQFVYVNATATGTDTTRNTVSILGDTVVNGKKFTRVSSIAAFDQGLLYNCDNQEYKVLVSLAALGVNTDSLKKALL